MKLFKKLFLKLRAYSSYRAGNYEMSTGIYKKLIELEPYNVSHYLCLGGALGLSGQYDKAIEAYKTAISLDNGNYKVYEALGGIYALLNKLDEAEEYYQKAISLNPDSDAAQMNIGDILKTKNLLHEGLNAYKRAARINPKNPYIYSAMADIHYRLGNYQEALDNYQKKYQFDKNSSSICCSIGDSNLKLKNVEEAIKFYKKAIRLDSYNPIPYASLGSIYLSQSRYDETIYVFGKVLLIKPEDVSKRSNIGTAFKHKILEKQVKEMYKEIHLFCLLGMAQAYGYKHKCEDAIRTYKSALELNNELIEAHTGIGFMYIDLQEFGQAKEAFFKALDIEPACVEALFGLGKIHAFTGNKEKALKVVEKLQSLSVTYSEELKKLLESDFPPEIEEEVQVKENSID